MKTNLIIDGNYLLMKNVFPLHNAKALYGELYDSLLKNIDRIKKYYHFDNIFFVSDKSSSWRKDLYPDYKGNRTKKIEIDWEFVFNTYEEVKNNLPINISLLESPKIEGDDWIYELVTQGNTLGYSNMIITNDYDIKQLLTYSLNPFYINFISNEMMSREKIFLPKNYEVFMSELKMKASNTNLFELSSDNEALDFLKKFTERNETFEEDSKLCLLRKIISGDKSDNISSAFFKLDKNGKKRGIGDRGAITLMEKYINEFGEPELDDPDLYENIADIICESKKVSVTEIPKITKKLELNRDIISLQEIPLNIREQMIEKIKDKTRIL